MVGERGMTVRPAVVDDAPAMGRLMVDSWLSAHRGQIPEDAWHQRVEQWTHEVSARGWARVLAERDSGNTARHVLLVAEDADGVVVAVVAGRAADDAPSGSIAEIGALYVAPDHHGQGIGRALVRAAAGELVTWGFSQLHLGVLTANLPARRFYEAMGGHEIGERTFDEGGYLLPVTVYGWSDINTVVGGAGTTSWR
ncbi:MAG: GNAT family N-acetyltransferase [Nocardioides sp.]